MDIALILSLGISLPRFDYCLLYLLGEFFQLCHSQLGVTQGSRTVKIPLQQSASYLKTSGTLEPVSIFEELTQEACLEAISSILICLCLKSTGVVLDRIFIFVVSDPSILPIWPLLIAL